MANADIGEADGTTAAVEQPGKRRSWWRNGIPGSSPVKSGVAGAITGFCLAVTASAAGTGHDSTAALLLFAGLFLSIPLLACLWWALERPRAGLSAMAAAALLTAGTVPLWGNAVFGGRDLASLWRVDTERPLGTQAVGSWAAGDLVVRVRPDRVTAYRLATGETAWQWTPPGTDTVCAMSRATGQFIGLLGHAAHDRPCGAVVALDLATGAPRWTATVAAPGRVGDPSAPDLLAVTGSTAVLQGADGWHAAALADGHELWHSATGPGCSPLAVAAGPDDVITVSRCGTDAPVLRELAAGDGSERLRTALPVSSDLTHLAVLSTAPLTVWVDEAAERGTHAVLGFDGTGRATATIPVVDDYTLDVALGGFSAFTARPSYGAVVTDGLLLVPAEKPGDVVVTAKSRSTKGRIVAYSLADGRRQWTAGLDDQVRGMAVDGGSVWVLTGRSLVRLTAATGQRTVERSADDSLTPAAPGDLWAFDQRFVFVEVDGTDGRSPAFAFR
ncbi:PQQ-binding-like beta-propeller repeat protein [Kitasatospora cinereorecta]|uniref:PQQ-binding-like beta-propeller repeat protein n=1 Tax=Kitasatospora cinereorecta TaxID=285560 RepID=A0ABW0VE00_9ACTN